MDSVELVISAIFPLGGVRLDVSGRVEFKTTAKAVMCPSASRLLLAVFILATNLIPRVPLQPHPTLPLPSHCTAVTPQRQRCLDCLLLLAGLLPGAGAPFRPAPSFPLTYARANSS